MRINARIAKLEKAIKPQKQVHQIVYLSPGDAPPDTSDWLPGNGIRYIVENRGATQGVAHTPD